MPNISPERIAFIRKGVESRSYPDGRLDDMLAAYDQASDERDRLRIALEKSEAYCRKMDGILEEVGGVTVSCINPYEDLKRAMLALKARAESR